MAAAYCRRPRPRDACSFRQRHAGRTVPIAVVVVVIVVVMVFGVVVIVVTAARGAERAGGQPRRSLPDPRADLHAGAVVHPAVHARVDDLVERLREGGIGPLGVVTPAKLESIVNVTASVSKKRCSAPVAAPLRQPWPAGYSGWLGVVTSEVQLGSPVSRGSPPPARIAVTGRQNRYSYLASQQAIRASELAVESMAK